ncbi:MAG TPA: hypothetical protein ENN63_05880 [Bacteroidetes bacterium]|nr:hypothetical protein [Bacteroidota bacterium]
MGLDIKIPIGFMFSLLGLLLTVHGIISASNEALYARSMGININLWTGCFMLAIGIILLIFSRLKIFKKRLEENIKKETAD